MAIRIYHNPRCSKSRECLAILQQHTTEIEVIDYLKQAPTVAELEHLLGLLGLEARQILRTKDAIYSEAGFDNTKLKHQQLLSLMHQYPAVIERPIVINKNKAVIGRPPENVLGIL